MNEAQKKRRDELAEKRAGEHSWVDCARPYVDDNAFKAFLAGATDEVLIKAIRLEERAKALDDCVKSMQRNGIGGWGIYEEDKEEAQAELEQLLTEHEA